jgi:hypothetical protein
MGCASCDCSALSSMPDSNRLCSSTVSSIVSQERTNGGLHSAGKQSLVRRADDPGGADHNQTGTRACP